MAQIVKTGAAFMVHQFAYARHDNVDTGEI